MSAILISIVSSLDYVSDDETEMLDGISELLKRLFVINNDNEHTT